VVLDAASVALTAEQLLAYRARKRAAAQRSVNTAALRNVSVKRSIARPVPPAARLAAAVAAKDEQVLALLFASEELTLTQLATLTASSPAIMRERLARLAGCGLVLDRDGAWSLRGRERRRRARLPAPVPEPPKARPRPTGNAGGPRHRVAAEEPVAPAAAVQVREDISPRGEMILGTAWVRPIGSYCRHETSHGGGTRYG
jgi:hypothetical protein